MFEFADAVDLANVDPAVYPNVAAYANGRFAAPADQLARFKRHKLIAVEPNNPGQAAIARTLDVERFDATIFDAQPFINERYNHDRDDAEIYIEISSVPALLVATGAETRDWYVWIAWWWLQGVPPTGADVLNELREVYKTELPANVHLSACQWENTPTFDKSVSYRKNTFTRER